MELTTDIISCIDKSVLCWLATASKENIPNVSPKEIFTSYQSNCIIIANIASPQSIKNIRENKQVCVSFIDILVQKGFQLKGIADVIDSSDDCFAEMERKLTKMTEGKFPFKTIIKIAVEQAKPIIAPKYVLYPETTEKEQIESARRAYGI